MPVLSKVLCYLIKSISGVHDEVVDGLSFISK